MLTPVHTGRVVCWQAIIAATDFIRQATGMSRKEAEQLCYVLGTAMKGIVYQTIIRNSPDLKKIASSARSITETIAQLWFRVIFLEKPPKR